MRVQGAETVDRLGRVLAAERAARIAAEKHEVVEAAEFVPQVFQFQNHGHRVFLRSCFRFLAKLRQPEKIKKIIK